MRKYKCFIDYEKEEKWLNGMARRGYILKSVGWGYRFERGEADKSPIRIDCRTFKKRSDFINYCTLFNDSGWKHIAGSYYSGTQYFKKCSGNATDDIFSDSPSKAGRYRRLSRVWLTLALSYLPILAALFATGAVNIEGFVNPRLLYYTPGLWEKAGADFWRAFLFETPFAFFRGFLWLLFPALIILYLVFALKTHHAYKKQMQ